MSKKNNYVFLESPINNKDEDIFNVSAYVEQLYAAFSSGAKFVAVDGEFGSGKSSIVNLFQNRINKCRKGISKYFYIIFDFIFCKKKSYFVNVNFLNINKKNNGDDASEDIIDSYHRYFVNQVANDLYKNPYEIEKVFYNNFFSYTTVRKPKNKFFSFLIDKILLILISLATIILIYFSFSDSLENIFGIDYFLNKFFPLLIFTIFVLVLIYGYGFYKPEMQEKSPMLDVDKCRNCLCKILFDIVPRNSTIYFIIDDLDRINDKLQKQIISLLYNEYYPLNNTIKNIELKFIFMIDLNKIDDDEIYKINYDKLFDYIVNVSNNQKHILHKYVEKQIQSNKVLNEIFRGILIKDYIVGLIVENYDSIRKIKHLFNRIITKYMYLNFQREIIINNEQMILVCILAGMTDSITLNKILNDKINSVSSSNFSGNSRVDKVVDYGINNKLIDNKYYIYLYNFMDENDLLNKNEQLIYDEVHDRFNNGADKWINIYKYLDMLNENYSNVYNHIYKYLSNDDKIMFLGHDSFSCYIHYNYGIDEIDMKDIYKISSIYLAFPIIKKYVFYRYFNVFLFSLDFCYDKHIDSRYDSSLRIKFEEEFNLFINNMNHCIKYFDLRKYINSFTVNKDFFEKIISYNDENNVPVIYGMILDSKLEWNKFLQFIDDDKLNEICTINDLEYRNKLLSSLLSQTISTHNKLKIMINLNIKYDNYEAVFEEFNNDKTFEFKFYELTTILNLYGYDNLLDKYIISFIQNSEYSGKMLDYICLNKFDLSSRILKEINNLSSKRAFSDFYEQLFKDKKFFELLIYSKLLNEKIFKYEVDLSNVDEYNIAINAVYLDMSNSFEKFKFSKKVTDIIVDTFDFKKINFNQLSFWKINILIPSLDEYEKCCKIFDRLLECNLLNEYVLYYKNNHNLDDKKILKFLSEYSNNNNLDAVIKSNITKTIHIKNSIDN